MIQDYTLRTVPFRVLRPALKLLPTMVTMVLGQVYTKDWPHKALAVKVFKLKDVTEALKNPTRNAMLTHLTSWYGVALELADAVEVDTPALADALRNATKEVSWLEPAWLYMQERMKEWVAENGGLVQ